MREIKFRAWDYKIDAMRSWEDIRANWTLHILDGDSNTEIMQFTGLHDKKGNEIYEGDFVNYGEYTDNHKPCNHEVVWDERHAQFGTRPIRKLPGDRSPYPMNTYGDIIGNIYQNPELLV